MQAIERSLQILEGAEVEETKRADVLNNFGVVLTGIGDYERARSVYGHCLTHRARARQIECKGEDDVD